MESDKWICIKDTSGDGNSLVLIDMCDNFSVSRKPMRADGAVMNPVKHVIALKGRTDGESGHLVQIVDLTSKEKLGVHQFPEDVVYWRWLSESLFAVVTSKAVFHWRPTGADSTPVRMFERAGNLADHGTQIIAYSADSVEKWCLLTGISTPDGGKTILGTMQLYSTEKRQQQLLEGHAGCFANLVIDPQRGPQPVLAFTERKKETPHMSRLHVMDVYTPRGDGPAPFKMNAAIEYPPEQANDFPVYLHLSERSGLLFMLSKGGLLFLIEPVTGTVLYRHKVSTETVFLCCPNKRNGGILMVNRKGVVLTATVSEDALVGFIHGNLRGNPSVNPSDLVMGLVKRYGYPGSDDVIQQDFDHAFARGDFSAAARLAATCKSGALRTPQTINKFRNAAPQPGQSAPLLLYFHTLLEHGKLNPQESLELVRPVVQQNKQGFLERWLVEDKLSCSEELGHLVRPMDPVSALSIFKRAAAHENVVQLLGEQGDFDGLAAYARSVNYQADYRSLLSNTLATNPEAAVNLSKKLLEAKPPLIDIDLVVELMVSRQRLKELSNVLLDVLSNDLPEQGYLQTKLYEVNLTNVCT
eukprot:GHVU01057396.1.p1 GENE.GHVU01057396.1~~GHVU01057396.1.p1  ORF type:complete len:618 (+),score=127.82 GHVU01057396.1:105-1856(+)